MLIAWAMSYQFYSKSEVCNVCTELRAAAVATQANTIAEMEVRILGIDLGKVSNVVKPEANGFRLEFA